jgi:hypothetical protein
VAKLGQTDAEQKADGGRPAPWGRLADMIVSASYRTDIPAHYGAWFRRRLAAGFVRVRNPYGGRDGIVSLRPGDVDGFVFWTRNVAPFLPALDDVAARGMPFTVQFTITGYPRAVEAGTLTADAALDGVRALARRWGPRAVVWRYDPVVLTDMTDAPWHRENFTRLAGALRGAVDEVVVSFVEPYRKTRRNLDAAARAAGFAWRDPPNDEKRALVADLAARADAHGMRLTLCTQPMLAGPALAGAAPGGAAPAAGPPAAACIDAGRLSDMADRAISAPVRGNRPGCLCAASRDIGAYDTCAQGCAYCYAVSSRAAARRALAAHAPTAESLAPVSAGRR